MSFPAVRRHGDVDRNPENEKKLRLSCLSPVISKTNVEARSLALLILVLATLAQWTYVRRYPRPVRKLYS